MKAMILAAGKGERMRPLTLTCPKPLLRAGGKSLIEYHIERLRAAGFRDLVINQAWLGEQLEAHLGDGRAHGVRITWSAEDQPLETAGGIRHALRHLTQASVPAVSSGGGEDWFLVINGDIWCDFDLARLQPANTGLAQLVLTANPAHNPGGDFALAENGSVRENDAERLTFTGISLLHRDLFGGDYGDDAKLAPLLRRATAAGQVSGVKHRGHWFDIGTPQRLAELDQWLSGTGRT